MFIIEIIERHFAIYPSNLLIILTVIDETTYIDSTRTPLAQQTTYNYVICADSVKTVGALWSFIVNVVIKSLKK